LGFFWIFLFIYFFYWETIDLFFDFNDLIDRFFLEAENNEHVVKKFKTNDFIIGHSVVKVFIYLVYTYSLIYWSVFLYEIWSSSS